MLATRPYAGPVGYLQTWNAIKATSIMMTPVA